MIRFRKWLAYKLANWARRIHPESPEAMAFWHDRYVDFVMTGQSIVKVSAVDPSQFAATEQHDRT